MTYKKLTKAAAGVTLALSLSSCNDGLTDLNVNPNAPTDVSAEYLFPQGAVALVSLLRGTTFDMTMTSLWAQHFAKIQYVDEDWYEIRPGTIDSYWSSLYSGGLQDLTQAADKATAIGNTNKAGPARIMNAWALSVMTELWGDIPYTEANSVDRGGTTTPVYDSQQAIYNALFVDLKSAHDQMGTGTGYGSADPIYGGSVTSWRKFANSLRARNAMRLSKADPTKARAELTAALTAGVFTSNADDAKLVWPGDGSNDSPIYSNQRPPDGKGSRDDHRVSKTLVDTLKALSDPRLAVYAQCTKDSQTTPPCQYIGVPNGLTSPDALALGFTRTSLPGTVFHDPSAPSWLMSYPEVLFIQAEAAERGWITGSAAAFYNAGISASMEQWGISAAVIATYLAQPRVVYTPVTGLTQIALQKWISLYGQGSDAWAEYRRTGVPDLRAGPAAIIPVVARRLLYPQSEQSFNKANLDAAVAAQGGAGLENRIWWDRP
ncbi:MAG: SusD/RagB family nutrient-binding outer membrane lipoprotein [Anaerolineae bacterium]|nr:SusD/RagB family nutrient-binding outer membrane lipoprotein [Gemmatimonadaceae bacterium]